MPRRKRIVESDEEYGNESNTKTNPQTPNKPKTNGSIQAAFARTSNKQLPRAASPSPLKAATRALPVRSSIKTSKASNTQIKSQSASPAKHNGNGNGKKIYSFFNNATQRQTAKPSASPEKRSVSAGVDDDLIVDSSGDEKPLSGLNRHLNRGIKRKVDTIDAEQDLSGSQKPPQKFLKSASTQLSFSSQQAPAVRPPREQRPWTEEYAPIDVDELAVHKRKVQDVKDWLARTVSGRERKRLLVLKGGAGTGKTATIKLVCQKLGLQVNEWRNPDAHTTGPATSLAAQFQDFVSRTNTFGSLSFAGSGATKEMPKSEEDHIVLVEEFPNTYSQSSSAVQSFRRAVLQFLAVTTPSADDFFGRSNQAVSVVPIVMIISESLLTTSTASADSFTAHRLLGAEILSHPGTTVFEFNAIAPTFMAKALDLVLKKEARQSGRRFAPGPAALRQLSEIGDIRSAISSLEFFCLHQGSETDWSGKIAFTKGKKKVNEATMTTMERESLQMITQRENTLGIFHAVGKVVYNKRELPAAIDTPPPQPPPWLPQYHRPKGSEVDVDGLLNELGTDINVFIAALHENYVLSCECLTEDDTLDTINGCMDSLSDSDLFSLDKFAMNHSRHSFQGSTTDALRQDEISFDTAVRGILFNLPHPVKRGQPPSDYGAGRNRTGKSSTGFQMLYPTGLRLWRKREQIEEIVEMFNDKTRRGELDTDVYAKSKRSQPVLGVVASWRKQSAFPGDLNAGAVVSEDESSTPPPMLRGSSKMEQLLERMPYMYIMERRKQVSARTSLSRQLDKVVSFNGMSGLLLNVDEEQEEDAANGEQWSTDKPLEEKSPRKRGTGISTKAEEEQGQVQKHIEQLVLSDDDIEDD